MVTLYGAGGLRVTLTSVEESVGTSRQILMEEMYVVCIEQFLALFHTYCMHSFPLNNCMLTISLKILESLGTRLAV